MVRAWRGHRCRAYRDRIAGRGARERHQRAGFDDELLKRLDEKTASAISIFLHAHPDLRKLCGDERASADPLLRALRPRDRRGETYRVLKRALDIAGALGLIALLAPVFLLIAALIKLTSRGPVFFKQVRVGEQAKPFRMLKFRTMFTGLGSGAAPGVRHAVHHLERAAATSQGRTRGSRLRTIRALRRSGDSSGRRASTSSRSSGTSCEATCRWSVPVRRLSYEVDVYQPWHRRRVLDAKPGITGLWQVEGPESHDVRRHGSPRPPIREKAVALGRHQDSPRDACGGHEWKGCPLIASSDYVCIAPDVKLGKNVKLAKFINLYGCDDRRRDEDRRVCRNSEKRQRWHALQDFKPHVHLRRRDDRRPRVHRSRRDIHQ